MRPVILLIITMLLLSSFKGDNSAVKVLIPSNYSGWAFLVGTNRKDLINTSGNCYVLNKDGIAYIDRQMLNKEFLIKYYKKNKRLTEKEVKYYFFTAPNIDGKEFEMLAFYILSNKELGYPDDYWEKELQKYLDIKFERIDFLIKRKIIEP